MCRSASGSVSPNLSNETLGRGPRSERHDIPCLHHLYKCADRRNPRHNVGSPSSSVCDRNNGPGERQEILEGIEKMTPGPIIPVKVQTQGHCTIRGLGNTARLHTMVYHSVESTLYTLCRPASICTIRHGRVRSTLPHTECGPYSQPWMSTS